MNNKISIIVPVYNEENNIKIFLSRLLLTLKKINKEYEVIFTLDPSSDRTEDIILEEIKNNNNLRLIVFSRRFGQPAATMAGIQNATGDRCVIIDCDLQDPPELIAENLNVIENNDIVHFVRKKRDDSFFQRIYTYIAYFILNLISFGKIERNAGHFKIVSPELVEKLQKNTLRHPYMNYFFSRYAKNPKRVFYFRKKRLFGESKFNIFSLNPWISFYGGVYFFTLNYLLFSILIFTISFISFKFLEIYLSSSILKYFFITFFIIQIVNLLITITNYLYNIVFKKKKISYKLI